MCEWRRREKRAENRKCQKRRIYERRGGGEEKGKRKEVKHLKKKGKLETEGGSEKT